MKKTTMRIVGFLLAAAALVFVTGCPQPESAKKPEPQKPAPQFDYSKLKNTKWMVYSFMDTNHATIANKGYFFAFDNKAVPELRVAYDDDTTSAGDAKTRAAAVKYTITGLDKIAIPELNLAEAKPFVIKASDPAAENKKSLTITVGTKKIILVPTTDASTFTADSTPENVVNAFNTLTGVTVQTWDPTQAYAKNITWKVTHKLDGTAVPAGEELHIAFQNNDDRKFKMGFKTDSESLKSNADTVYEVPVVQLGGSLTVTCNELGLTNAPFVFDNAANPKTLTMGQMKLVLTTSNADAIVDALTTGKTPAEMAAKFGKK